MEMELTGEKIGMRKTVTDRERGLAWIMLVIGFFYIEWIAATALGLGVTLFTLLFCGTAGFYMQKNGFLQTKISLFYLGLTALSAVNFAVFDNDIMGLLNFFFLHWAAVYWVCVSCKRRIAGDLSSYVLGDTINQMLLVPFGNFGREFVSLFGAAREKKNISQERWGEKWERRKNILFGAAGLLLMLPLLLLVINLLTSADAAFADFISRINVSFAFKIPENMLRYVGDFLFGIPVACYLFGLLYGNTAAREPEMITQQSFDSAAAEARIMPKAMVCTGVGALILIYVLFFATQAGYLFSAFRNNLPVTMTYAEYARRGFFELCAVAGINLVVIAASNLFAQRQDGSHGEKRLKALRVETGALCVLTMMLIAAAVSKMMMYIHYYGLTQLRFYTTAFMALLFVCFGIILASQLKKLNCAKWLALTCIVGFLIFAYSDVDGAIAKYNIERYEAGTLKTIDVQSLAGMSDAAVEPLCRLFNETEDGEIRKQIYMTLVVYQGGDRLYSEPEGDYRQWNYQRSKAETVLANMNWGNQTEDWLSEYYGDPTSEYDDVFE